MTPNIAIIHVLSPAWHGREFKLWVPLILLWLPIILLSPLILLVVFGLCVAGRVSLLDALRVIWAITCSLPGIDVRVTADGNEVLVRIL